MLSFIFYTYSFYVCDMFEKILAMARRGPDELLLM